MIKSFHHYASTGMFGNAKQLRQTLTPAEKYLWKLLRGRNFDEHKFRRQHPIGPYIVDFFYSRSNLAIEVDGPIHNDEEHKRYDAERTDYLMSLDIKVIRFTNGEVLRDIDKVLETIRTHINC